MLISLLKNFHSSQSHLYWFAIYSIFNYSNTTITYNLYFNQTFNLYFLLLLYSRKAWWRSSISTKLKSTKYFYPIEIRSANNRFTKPFSCQYHTGTNSPKFPPTKPSYYVVTLYSNNDVQSVLFIQTPKTGSTRSAISRLMWYKLHAAYVTGFEKRRLPHTQQQDTLFTIKR